MKYPEYEDLQEFLNDLVERGWDSWKTPEEKKWRDYCAKETAKQFATFVEKERK